MNDWLFVFLLAAVVVPPLFTLALLVIQFVADRLDSDEDICGRDDQ